VHLTNHTGTRITLGLQARLYFGNLDAKRDWGHARDDVRVQWLMLQQDHPEDYVIATGEQHSVRDFFQQAAREIGIAIRWEGSGVDARRAMRLRPPTRKRRGAGPEKNAASSPSTRATSAPTEVDTLLGDASKACRQVGWEPEITAHIGR
jgi:GDPmannose 4,6-dehydratase